MASLCRRYKWQMRSVMLGYKKEVACFVGLVFAGIVFIRLLTNMQENEGTYIDLSPQRQQELIDEWAQQREQRQGEAREDTGAIDSEFNRRLEMNAAKLAQEHKKLMKQNVEKERFGDYDNPFEDAGFDNGNVDANNHGEQGPGKNVAADENLIGGRAQCTLYDISKDIEGDFDCLKLDLKPSVPVCLHPDGKDVHVSRSLRQEGIWEPHIIRQFQNVLYGEPELGLIDIGAHIGTYSLIAANMGHHVVAVEPLRDNLVRFHKAIKMSGVENLVSVVQNTVSDNRRITALKMFRDNRGGTQIDHEDPCYVKGCNPTAKSIYMDDLLEVINFKKAIIKIDIEGNEHRAFVHSSKLLKEVFVPYIFMEWMKLRSYYGSEIDTSEDKDLTGWLVGYLIDHGYTAYSSVTGVKLTASVWYSWTDDIWWKHDFA